MDSHLANPPQPPLSNWSTIVKHTPNPNPPYPLMAPSCKSSKGISIAVVDANAIIQGGERLSRCADKFVSISEVISEIRDPTSRHRLAVFPFSVDTLEPSPDALKKVISFARATGDLQTLSDVDLKLIALTYTLESQFHGTAHLRDCPPPVRLLNVRRLPEKELPGWGSNVPNLEEWKALEGATNHGPGPDSKILPLKDLNLNILAEDRVSLQDGSVGNGSVNHDLGEEHVDETARKPRRYLPKKREVKIEGKKMVADGIDASLGQYDDDTAGDWRPAVSRSTHRRYLRRKARREMYEASMNDDVQQDVDNNDEENIIHEMESQGQVCEEDNVDKMVSEERENTDRMDGSEDISLILKQMRLVEDTSNDQQERREHMSSDAGIPSTDAISDAQAYTVQEGDDDEADSEGLDHIENYSQASESVDASFVDDDSSEQSWVLRSLSDSSVACITGDFAMQNVILQMGLRLLAPGGMQIRELHRWVMKCHACNKVNYETQRIFCPKCGNGGTLRKVAVTVGENGVVLATRRPRISLRGTRFSLPLPQGGREGVAKNPILREDQVPNQYLYPKTKKKPVKQEDDFFGSGKIFSHHTDKKAAVKPPVRQALAVFSGKRNPNDNHSSRSKR